MTVQIIFTSDYEHMSNAAADILIPDLNTTTKINSQTFNLGLATGSTPSDPGGLYDIMVKLQQEYDASKIRTWNLDEYIAKGIKTASARALHPESYTFFMIQKLLGRLNPLFASSNIPPGLDINHDILVANLDEFGDQIEYVGSRSGKAVLIPDSFEESNYLGMISAKIDCFIDTIVQEGGIDSWVTGVGGNGHRGFHEAGIPYDLNQLAFLVYMAQSTKENAIADEHFGRDDDCYDYAVTMSNKGVLTLSNKVYTLANGSRKTQPITDGLLGPITDDIPISYDQKFLQDKDTEIIYILDQEAAAGLFEHVDKLMEMGYIVTDLRS